MGHKGYEQINTCICFSHKYEACPEDKDTSRVADREFLYVYYGNNVVELHPSPVSQARLTVVEPAFFV
jgi:hypothetical protein